MPLSDDDHISRSIIYAKAFLNSIHVDQHLFIFGQTHDDGASHESGIARSIAVEDAEVHRIGCSIAKIQNERIGSPDPGPKRRYYCGFRTAALKDLQLSGEGWAVKLALHEEGGEPSHVDIALFVDSTDKNKKNTIKTDAGLTLAEAFGPAAELICELDRGDEHHPLIKDPDCLRKGLE